MAIEGGNESVPVGYVAFGVFDGNRTFDVISRTKESIIALALSGYEPSPSPIYTEKEYQDYERIVGKHNQDRRQNRVSSILSGFNVRNTDLNDPANKK